MVRQIALEFAYKKKAKGVTPDKEGIELAMAFALAVANRKAKAKIRQLTKVSIPFWVVQISDTSSILLSATGESTMTLELSENQALGPVRRIISNETADLKDIPEAIDKALPLLRKAFFLSFSRYFFKH